MVFFERKNSVGDSFPVIELPDLLFQSRPVLLAKFIDSTKAFLLARKAIRALRPSRIWAASSWREAGGPAAGLRRVFHWPGWMLG